MRAIIVDKNTAFSEKSTMFEKKTENSFKKQTTFIQTLPKGEQGETDMSELILWVTRERIGRGMRIVRHATINGTEENGDCFICKNAIKKDAFAKLPTEIRNRISEGELRIVIRDGIKIISSGAFKGCTSLVSVEITGQVTIIGERAFSDCIGMTSVRISNSVETIKGSAFRGCRALENVIFDNDPHLKTIESGAFRGV